MRLRLGTGRMAKAGDIEETERERLERMELETLDNTPSSVYAKLLIVYLMEDEMLNAKFLWKRIPEATKTATPELDRLWTIGRALTERKLQEVYQSLEYDSWSEEVKEMLPKLKESIQQRYISLISQSYSSISISEFSQFLSGGSLSDLEASNLARNNLGWKVEGEFILPKENVKTSAADQKLSIIEGEKNREKLSKLTDFVSFLEK